MKTTIKQYWAFAIAALTVLATACGGAKKFGEELTAGSAGVGGSTGTAGSCGTCEGQGGTSTGGCAGQGGSTNQGGAAGTSATGGSGGTSKTCIPNEQIGCPCGNGQYGYQVCREDGLSYGPCDHCSGGTGGASGQGGTSTGGSSQGGSGTGGSATGGSAGSGPLCVPGKQETCSCGSYNGFQVCKADGMSFETCVCSGQGGAGGMGGSAGTGGASGQGGTSTGGSAGTGGSNQLCVPNQDYSCACGGGVSGTQRCASDGMSLGSCTCGTGGTGGSGGSFTVATVVCEAKHADNTQFVFNHGSGQFTSQLHNYRVFVSDLGVDGLNKYAGPDHVEWGQDSKLNLQQLGSSVKFSFTSTLGSLLDVNITRDPTGTNESSGDYWHDPACDPNKLVPLMRVECSVSANGSTTHMQWPTVLDTGLGCNLRLAVSPITTSSNDEDGDGAVKGEDCDDTPGSGFFKRGSPLADKSRWLVEVMNDGIDNDCQGGDLKYYRVRMTAPNGLGTPMVFWDSFANSVNMTYDNGNWVSQYLPITYMPTDKMSGQSASQPGGLVHFFGSGTGCYQGECWNMYRDSNLHCVDVYPVTFESSDHAIVIGSSTMDVDGQCRVFFAAAQ